MILKISKDDDRLSVMMRHYLATKEKYPDCVLFYRLGDFYEMFLEDAVEVSKLLELTLTGRDCGLPERVPMCGIPYHAAESYIAKLVSFGKKVAICEQLSDPKASKGLVDRDVIKIVTGGTVTEDKFVDERSNNFIFAACEKSSTFAASWADITTGEFYGLTALSFKEILDVIFRINPAEIIANERFFATYSLLSEGVKSTFVTPHLYKEKAFEQRQGEKLLCEQFSIKDISAVIPVDNAFTATAAGAVLSYLKETQMHAISNIRSIRYYDDGRFLKLDSTALKNLEIISSLRDGKLYGSLLWAIDKTVTSGGGRRIKSMLVSPLKDIDAINYRLDGVEELFGDNTRRESIVETLKSVKDLARLCGRISNDVVNPRDCLSILQTLDCSPAIKMQLLGASSAVLQKICADMGDFSSLANVIRDIIQTNAPVTTKDGGFVKDGFDEQLDKYRDIEKNARKIIAQIEERERNATGIRTLKIGYNKVFGYYIEVSKSFVDQVPYTYIRKQTLVNGERYITEELKNFEVEVLSSGSNIVRIENEIFDKLKGILKEALASMLTLAKAFSMLDVLCSFATVARQRGYCRPQIIEANRPMNIVGGRHPIVEANGKNKFIPNDTYLDLDENSMMIITGPNMAGKSTYMRQVALITLLAHVGAFVPAKEAEIPLTDKIFTRVGASDNLLFDQSTFMVEMSELANILKNATSESLVILDEVGRGTSTFDGLSIAWAVVEYMTEKKKIKTLFATHYHELSELEDSLGGVKNYKMTVKEINGEIVFLRKVLKGSANKSFGIEVAALAGVPDEVTLRAKKILRSLEKNDLVIKGGANDSEEETVVQQSFVEEYIKKLDLNNITPLKAFEILNYLKEKCDGEN